MRKFSEKRVLQYKKRIERIVITLRRVRCFFRSTRNKFVNRTIRIMRVTPQNYEYTIVRVQAFSAPFVLLCNSRLTRQ